MKRNDIVLGGLGIALVFVATMFIKIPLGPLGYLNLGDGFILLFANLLSPLASFFVGGIGSAMADLAGGYGAFAIYTLFIKGAEGLLVCLILKKYGYSHKLLAFLLGTGVMILGYVFANTMLAHSFAMGLSGIPSNLLQGTLDIVIALLLSNRIQKQK